MASLADALAALGADPHARACGHGGVAGGEVVPALRAAGSAAGAVPEEGPEQEQEGEDGEGDGAGGVEPVEVGRGDHGMAPRRCVGNNICTERGACGSGTVGCSSAWRLHLPHPPTRRRAGRGAEGARRRGVDRIVERAGRARAVQRAGESVPGWSSSGVSGSAGVSGMGVARFPAADQADSAGGAGGGESWSRRRASRQRAILRATLSPMTTKRRRKRRSETARAR